MHVSRYTNCIICAYNINRLIDVPHKVIAILVMYININIYGRLIIESLTKSRAKQILFNRVENIKNHDRLLKKCYY